MPLELSQLHSLLMNTQASVLVGNVPSEALSHLRSQTTLIHLSSDSLKHMIKAHPEQELYDYLAIPEMVAKALWIADRPNWCCLSYQSPHDGNRYKGAVKSAANGSEHFITTFHRVNPRNTTALLKRGPVVRKHL